LSGSIVLAAVLKDKRFIGKKVCCIISGGNMDLSSFFLKKNSDISAKL
jgi:threonine dehydratase